MIYQIMLRIFQNIYYFPLFMLQNDCFSFHHTSTAYQFLFLQNSWMVHSYSLIFIMGDILADTAILGNTSKKEHLCSCYEHTSRARLQLDGVAAEKRRLCLSRESVNLQLSLANWRTVFSFRFDSYFTLLKLSFVKNYHLSTFITFAKQSMINRLSNPINRNRSAAKISKVMSSSFFAIQLCIRSGVVS